MSAWTLLLLLGVGRVWADIAPPRAPPPPRTVAGDLEAPPGPAPTIPWSLVFFGLVGVGSSVAVGAVVWQSRRPPRP